MFLILWKKSVVASLVFSCLAGTGLAAWEEKAVVPVEYQKVEYQAEGEFFWLQKPGEKKPRSYYLLSGELKSLPDGVELRDKEVTYGSSSGEPLLQVSQGGKKTLMSLREGRVAEGPGSKGLQKRAEVMLPGGVTFRSTLLLRRYVEENGEYVEKFEGVFGLTSSGWKVYPYLGEKNFGEPISIGTKENDYQNAVALQKGYYRLGRSHEDGDALLDLKNKLVRNDANGVAKDGTRFTQEKWVGSPIKMPGMIVMGGGFFGGLVSGATYGVFSGGSNSNHIIRLRDEKGGEITTFWEAISLGENYIGNRYKAETRIVDYDGNGVRSFSSAKEGYLPLLGKYDLPEQEEGKPRVFGKADWSNWPGEGRYQPYYRYGQWSVFDFTTGNELVDPEPRFGQIIKVSPDGNSFWSLIEEGKGKDRRFGVKRFDLVQ